MTGLSREARGVLQRGLACDGPSRERRARVKQRVFVALGSGTLASAGATAAAAQVGSLGSAGVLGIKSLMAASFFWFGVGATVGLGVAGGAALVARPSQPQQVLPPSPAREKTAVVAARATPSLVAARVLSTPPALPEAPVQGQRSPFASAPRPARGDSSGELAPVPQPAPVSSTIGEETLLLQRAQRALAAKQPNQALELLAEHERRFASGVLSQERTVAKLLAWCALGRSEEARALARAFLSSAPRSVLVPRLEHSCVADQLAPGWQQRP